MEQYILYAHQEDGFLRGKQKNMAYFWECGCGKTVVAIELLKYWKSLGHGPALVVCPVSILEVAWMHDLQKFAPDLKACLLRCKGTGAALIKKQRKLLDEDYDVYVVNFEQVSIRHSMLVDKNFGSIVVDESSRMRSPFSLTTKALLAFAGFDFSRSCKIKARFPAAPIRNRIVLSGTPAPRDRMQYWAQIKFVTGYNDNVFSSSYMNFRGRYFEDANATKHWATWPNFKFRCRMSEEFNDRLASVSHRVDKASALDLPEKLPPQVRALELSRPEMAAYLKMKHTMAIMVEEGAITAVNAISKLSKLRQLASGWGYPTFSSNEDTMTPIQFGTTKLTELEEIVSSTGEQILIWAAFRFEIDQIARKLQCPKIYAGVTPSERTEIIQRFMSGKEQYLVAHPQSLGHGVTLTNCHTQVHFSLSYDYELLKQSMDRTHRIGQHNPCAYYFLLAKDTVDFAVFELLNDREKVCNAVLDHIKEANRKGK